MKKQYILPLGLFLLGIFILIKKPLNQKNTGHKHLLPKEQEMKKVTTKIKSEAQLFKGGSARKTHNAKSGLSFEAPYIYFSDQLKHFKQCLEKIECPQYSQVDPKSYQIAIHQDIKSSLDTLDDWVRRHNFRDERISPLMRDLLTIDSGGVKLSALKVLSTQDTDNKNLDSILREVFGSYHVQPVRLGLTELSRYKDPTDQKYIHNHLQYTLLKGSLHVAEELAKNIDLLIESPTRYSYDSVLSDLRKMPINENVYVALNNSLNRLN